MRILRRYGRSLFLPILMMGWICAAGANDANRTPSHFAQRRVSDLEGITHRLPDPKAKATVLIFVSHDCPIANSYAPEIKRIAARYAPQQVAFFLIYAEPDLSDAQARAHARAYGYRCAALHAGWRDLARSARADVSPEAVVLTPDGVTRYRGRIDDLYVTFGVSRPKARTHDLRNALEAVLHGKSVHSSQTHAIGCFLATDE